MLFLTSFHLLIGLIRSLFVSCVDSLMLKESKKKGNEQGLKQRNPTSNLQIQKEKKHTHKLIHVYDRQSCGPSEPLQKPRARDKIQ